MLVQKRFGDLVMMVLAFATYLPLSSPVLGLVWVLVAVAVGLAAGRLGIQWTQLIPKVIVGAVSGGVIGVVIHRTHQMPLILLTGVFLIGLIVIDLVWLIEAVHETIHSPASEGGS